MRNFKIKITIEVSKQVILTEMTDGKRQEKKVKQHSPYQIYQQWVQAFKKTQRPLWVDPEIQNCYICEKEF